MMTEQTSQRFNDKYATATEAFICNYFENVTPEEYARLTEEDKAELYMPCLLALEPYD